MHLSTSIGTGKTPMSLATLRIALTGQGFNMLPQMVKAFEPFGQASALKNADLDLGYVSREQCLGV